MAGDVILIVEDNEKNMKLTRDVLQFHGFTVLEATTAEDGIAVAQAHTPGLILLDIQLPGIDGVTALGRLRADPLTASIPVMALTAFAMKDDELRLRGAQFGLHASDAEVVVEQFPGLRDRRRIADDPGLVVDAEPDDVLTGVAYLHNGTDDRVAALRGYPQDELGRFFTGQDRGAFMGYLRSRLSPTNASIHADRLLHSFVAPSKQLLAVAAEEAGGVAQQWRLMAFHRRPHEGAGIGAGMGCFRFDIHETCSSETQHGGVY